MFRKLSKCILALSFVLSTIVGAAFALSPTTVAHAGSGTIPNFSIDSQLNYVISVTCPGMTGMTWRTGVDSAGNGPQAGSAGGSGKLDGSKISNGHHNFIGQVRCDGEPTDWSTATTSNVGFDWFGGNPTPVPPPAGSVVSVTISVSPTTVPPGGVVGISAAASCSNTNVRAIRVSVNGSAPNELSNNVLTMKWSSNTPGQYTFTSEAECSGNDQWKTSAGASVTVTVQQGAVASGGQGATGVNGGTTTNTNPGNLAQPTQATQVPIAAPVVLRSVAHGMGSAQGLYVYVPAQYTGLYLRSSPDNSNNRTDNIIAVMNPGDYYAVLQTSSGWAKVHTSLGDGWVSTQLAVLGGGNATVTPMFTNVPQATWTSQPTATLVPPDQPPSAQFPNAQLSDGGIDLGKYCKDLGYDIVDHSNQDAYSFRCVKDQQVYSMTQTAWNKACFDVWGSVRPNATLSNSTELGAWKCQANPGSVDPYRTPVAPTATPVPQAQKPVQPSNPNPSSNGNSGGSCSVSLDNVIEGQGLASIPSSGDYIYSSYKTIALYALPDQCSALMGKLYMGMYYPVISNKTSWLRINTSLGAGWIKGDGLTVQQASTSTNGQGTSGILTKSQTWNEVIDQDTLTFSATLQYQTQSDGSHLILKVSIDYTLTYGTIAVCWSRPKAYIVDTNGKTLQNYNTGASLTLGNFRPQVAHADFSLDTAIMSSQKLMVEVQWLCYPDYPSGGGALSGVEKTQIQQEADDATEGNWPQNLPRVPSAFSGDLTP